MTFLDIVFALAAVIWFVQFQVLGRLRDKHVNFLIVERGQYKPVLGIELDGASHENDQQQYRDVVKDTLLASARLPLIRLDARQRRQPTELRELVQSHISAPMHVE